MAGAWNRGSIKLWTENPVPGEPGLEHHCLSYWSSPRMLSRSNPDRVDLHWCSFCTLLVNVLAFCRRNRSSCFCKCCYQDCFFPETLILVGLVVVLRTVVLFVLWCSILLSNFLWSVRLILGDSVNSIILFFCWTAWTLGADLPSSLEQSSIIASLTAVSKSKVGIGCRFMTACKYTGSGALKWFRR